MTGRERRPIAPALVVVAFAAAVLALQIAGTFAWTGSLWGTHSWAFLPPWAMLVALALTLAAAVPLLLWIDAARRGTRAAPLPGAMTEVAAAFRPRRGNGSTFSLRSVALGVASVLVAFGVLWLIRSRHALLGDGIAILSGGIEAGDLHELEPLTPLLQAAALEWVRGTWGAGAPAREVTWSTVALVSTFAGALFVPVAWALAGEIERAGTPAAPTPRARPRRRRADSREARREGRWARPLVFAILILQGYLLLFCGYVENYAPLALAHAVALWTGLRCAHGRGSYLAFGIAVMLAVSLHFSGAVLIPAWAALTALGLVEHSHRRRAAFGVGATVLIAVAIAAALTLLHPGYSLAGRLWEVTVRAVGQRQENPTYLLSLRHALDLLNGQMLIGPLGMFAFLGGVAVLVARRGGRGPAATFVLVAGLAAAGACAVAGDSNLGYARNWDLLAPMGVALTAAGLYLVRPAFARAGAWPRALLVLAALSAFHTVPWIAVNASETRALARFKSLPLGRGRTETTVALWHAERGDFAAAKRWIDRSLAIDPLNNRAVDLLGRIAFDQKDPRLALRAYLVAVSLRPDKHDYREQLARAVAAVGGPSRGLGQLDSLIATHPDQGGLWLERAMLLRACGRPQEADEARSRALALAPELAAYADTLPRLEAGILSAHR